MPSFSVVPNGPEPVPAPGPARQRVKRDGGGLPLYRQVCDQVEALAMSAELGDERPLPPEGQLIARFGVSRGTLRRATDELARQGLLRIEPGRGTFVVQATKVRWLVWDRLLGVAKPDSRFDLDLSRFVPDFEGRERCDDQLRELPAYSAARTVFLAPDNSLEAMRRRALGDGKRIIVPSYGLRRGLVLLDPAALGAADHRLAATLDGMEQLGRRLPLAEVRGLGAVDLVVSGAVAVTRRGLHFGGGDGFFDLEWGLLRHCGLVTSRTPVVVVVHDCQVLDADIRPGPHDAVADTVITPDAIVNCSPPLAKPDGIFWDELRGTWADSDIPYVRDLIAELDPDPGTPAGQAAVARGGPVNEPPANETLSAADAAAHRERIWAELAKVGRPDSRFHWDFSSFIADFEGSDECARTVRSLAAYQAGGLLFITPDNSTEELRAQAMSDRRPFLMSTYGLVRGFLYLDPADVPPAERRYAATLDGMDRYATPVSLAQVAGLGPVAMLVTGGSAVSRNGVRFGKGHGYFDLEFAMLSEIGVVGPGSQIVDVVHDCQVVDGDLVGEDHDVPVDWIVTPTRRLHIPDNGRTPGRVRWELLDGSPLRGVPPMEELASLRDSRT